MYTVQEIKDKKKSLRKFARTERRTLRKELKRCEDYSSYKEQRAKIFVGYMIAGIPVATLILVLLLL